MMKGSNENPSWKQIFQMHERLLKWGLYLICLFSVFPSCFSQKVNLFDVLQTGEKHYPFLKAKEAELKSAANHVEYVKTEFLPDLSIGHQYTYSTSNNVEGTFLSNGGTAFSPSGGIRNENIYEGAFGSLTSSLLEWNVVSFGKVSAHVDVARSKHKYSQADYDNELFQFQVRLTHAYLLLLIGNHLSEVQQHNLHRAEAFKSSIRAMVIAGLRPGVDSSVAEAEFVKAKLLLLESRKNEKVQERRLNELIGGGHDTIFIDTMNFFNRLPDSVFLPVEKYHHSPVLNFYKSQIELSKALGVSVKRNIYPTVAIIGAAWGRGSGISNKDQTYRTDLRSGINYQVYNYLAGVAFRWNLINIKRTLKDFKSAQFQTEKFEFLYQNQHLVQNRELSEAKLQFSVSLQQAYLAPIQLHSAIQAFEQARARYENGLTDLPTFTHSMFVLNRSEADLYMAASNAWQSLLMMAAAAGDLSIFFRQIQ